MSTLLQLDGGRVSWRGHLARVAVAALLGILAYLAALSWPLFFPRPVHVAAAAPDCDLNAGPCAAAFDATRFIRLAIAPEAPSVNGPLRVLVETAGFPADQASVTFSGVDMNMGLIRNELLSTGGDSFAGDVVLPVCVRRRMTWRATVAASGKEGEFRATFDFEVERH